MGMADVEGPWEGPRAEGGSARSGGVGTHTQGPLAQLEQEGPEERDGKGPGQKSRLGLVSFLDWNSVFQLGGS